MGISLPHFSSIFCEVSALGVKAVPSGSPRTEQGTGNRTVLEPEPAEPAIKTELAELEPISNSSDPELEPVRTGTVFRASRMLRKS